MTWTKLIKSKFNDGVSVKLFGTYKDEDFITWATYYPIRPQTHWDPEEEDSIEIDSIEFDNKDFKFDIDEVIEECYDDLLEQARVKSCDRG